VVAEKGKYQKHALLFYIYFSCVSSMTLIEIGNQFQVELSHLSLFLHDL
jgi:hypothetical protein